MGPVVWFLPIPSYTPNPNWLALVTVTFFQYTEHTKLFLTLWPLHMVSHSAWNTCPLVVLLWTWLAFPHPSSLALNVTSSEMSSLMTLCTSIFLYLCTLCACIMVRITICNFHLCFTCSVVCLPPWCRDHSYTTHHYSFSTWHNVWHNVNIQYIFPEWFNDLISQSFN